MEHIQWKQSMLRYNDLRVLLVYKVIAVSSPLLRIMPLSIAL